MISIFIVFPIYAGIILLIMNKLTDSLCIQKEIPEDRQAKVFKTINILVTILLISSYVEILFTH
ncbi:hypothetical protein M3182_10000 [Mesobacillus maritimus]|uniref:hypothetical protein n=1 Tax=Mesobacillus maritimus TaxID=1643336 RepID=UPI00203C777A|nr:hypothetical protein [Mesobacillus maritimus]MCM3586059.1 hypothetical protein [Mesobacillus maritimus]MCM3667386.1 hypothetical protein [Mesobacillus maritimus]